MTFGALWAALTASASFVCRLTRYGSTNFPDVGVAGGKEVLDVESAESALNLSIERDGRSRVFRGVMGRGAAIFWDGARPLYMDWGRARDRRRGWVDWCSVVSGEGEIEGLLENPFVPFLARPELRAEALPMVSSFAPLSESSSSVVSIAADIDLGELENTAVLTSRDWLRECGVIGRSADISRLAAIIDPPSATV